jgi:hypothetical protein
MTTSGQGIQYFMASVPVDGPAGDSLPSLNGFGDMSSGIQQRENFQQQQPHPQNLPPQRRQRQQGGSFTPPGSRPSRSATATAKAKSDAAMAAEAADDAAKKGKSGWGLGSMVGRLIGKKDEMEDMHADEMSMYFDEKLNKWIDPSNPESLEPDKTLAPPGSKAAVVGSFLQLTTALVLDKYSRPGGQANDRATAKPDAPVDSLMAPPPSFRKKKSACFTVCTAGAGCLHVPLVGTSRYKLNMCTVSLPARRSTITGSTPRAAMLACAGDSISIPPGHTIPAEDSDGVVRKQVRGMFCQRLHASCVHVHEPNL